MTAPLCGRKKWKQRLEGGIKNETEVTGKGSRRNRVTISEKKSRVVDFV